MPYNPIYDGQFDYPEKIYNLSYSPYINSDIDMPTPLFSPDKKLTSGVGFGESSYDTEESAMSVTNPSFINRNRAYKEPEYVKGFNSIVGGVVSGLATAVQDVSYLLDIENGIKRLTGAEEVQDNFVSKAMKEFKQGLATEMPIYREDPNKVWSWSDSGSYWEALKGVIDSAVGFGLPGLGAAKLVGSAVKAARVNALLQGMLTANRAEALTSIGAGFLTNYAEGKTMAIEAYENSMKNLKSNYYDSILKKYVDQGLDPGQAMQLANEEYEAGLKNGKEAEFSKIAGNEADKFQRNNMIFMLTDAMGIHGILKGVKGGTRNIITKESMKNYFLGANTDNFFVQGVKEGAEEIGQNMMQSEAEYQAAEKGGIDTGEPDNFTSRMIKFATDDKALLEGAMGFLGGPVQRVLMNTLAGKYGSNYKKSIEEQIAKQEEQFTENEEFLKSSLSNIDNLNTLKKEAFEKGDMDSFNALNKQSFALVAANNFVNGTTERLERSLHDALELSDEEATKLGYDPNFREQANSMLNDLKVLEKEWIGISGYDTASDLFMSMQNHKYFKDLQSVAAKNLEQSRNNLRKYLNEFYSNEALNNEGLTDEEIDTIVNDLEVPDTFESQKGKIPVASLNRSLSSLSDVLQNEDVFLNAIKAKEDNDAVVKARLDEMNKISYLKTTEANEAYRDTIKNAKKILEEADRLRKESNSKKESKINRKKAAANHKESTTKKEDESVSTKSTEGFDTPSDATDEDFGFKPTELNEDDLDKSIDPAKAAKTKEEVKAENDEIQRQAQEALSTKKEVEKELEEAEREAKKASEDKKEFNEDSTDIEAKKADIERKFNINFNKLYWVGTGQTINDVIQGTNQGHNTGTPENIHVYDLGNGYIAIGFSGGKNVTITDSDNNEYVFKIFNPSKSNTALFSIAKSKGGVVIKPKLISLQKNALLKAANINEDEFDNLLTFADKINTKYDAELISLRNSIKSNPNQVASKLEEDEAKINDTGYTEATNNEVEKTSGTIDTSIEDASRAVVNPDGSISYDYNRINQGNNVIAFLSRTYKDIAEFIGNILHISRKNIDNSFNESSKVALRRNSTKVGTKLKFVIEDNPDTEIYISESTEKTTWGAFKSSIPTDDQILYIPIAIYNEAGEKIGYVHDVNWITEKHVSGDLQEDLEKLKSIRKAIASGKNTGVIMSSNPGLLFKTHNRQFIKVSEAMSDPNLELAIGKDGMPYISTSSTSKKTPINKVKDGLLYAMIPYGDKHLAIPLKINTIQQNHSKAIIEALRIYATNNTNDPFRKYVLQELKLDITTSAGINAFLKLYVNDTELVNNTIPGSTDRYRFHVNKGKIYFARGGTDISKVPYLAQSGNQDSNKQVFKLIEDNLNSLFYNISLQALSDGKIISINENDNASTSNYKDHVKEIASSNILGVNVGTESNPEYTYTIQPTIKYKLDGLENKPTKTEDKAIEEPKVLSKPTTEEPIAKKKALPKGLVKKLKSDDEIDESYLLDDNTKANLEASTKKVYSTKLGAKMQNSIISYIVGRVLNKVFTESENTKDTSKKFNVTGELEAAKEEYNKLKTEAEQSLEELNSYLGNEEYDQDEILDGIDNTTRYIGMLNNVLDDWNILTRLSLEYIYKINNANMDVLSEEELSDNLEENGESEERAFDASQLTFDTLNKLSIKVKRLFGGIKKVKSNGEILTNAFGQEVVMPFDEVYNALQAITADLKPSYETIKAKLLASKDKFPWVTQVIEKLDSAEESTRNAFVTGMTNHTRSMKFYMWSRDKNGKYVLVEYDANANSLTQVILGKWFNNISYNSTLTKYMVIDSEVKIVGNPEEIDIIEAAYDDMVKDIKSITNNELISWLYSMGIEVSDFTINYIRNNKVNTRDWESQFTSKSGIFNVLRRTISTIKNDTIDQSEFIKSSRLKNLAEIEAMSSKDVLPTSFRAGKKSVFSYGNNNLLVDSIRRLKDYNTLDNGETTSDYLTELMETSFTRESYWLKGMLVYDESGNPIKGNDGKYRININSAAFANLNHSVMSLEAIKQQGSKSRDNRELHKLSPAEIELVKIAMMQSQAADLSGNNKRRIRVTFPTTSDKTTVMMLSTVAFDITFNEDGNVDKDTLDRLYDVFVLPELIRITNHQANSDKNNIDAYNTGANHFLLFPAFNSIEGLFDSNGNISLDAYNAEFKEKFINVISNYITTLVDEKLSNWNTYGIGVSDKQSTHKFLDSKYMNNITTKGVAKENAVRAAATDMVVQYLVSNTESMKMFIGDPAQFWKSKSNDIIEACKDLYDNVGKRLAALIAPGTALAESEGDNYIQIFVKDHEVTAKEIEGILARYLSEDKLAAYMKINSADAQEYTTWKEHLKVLRLRGNITLEDEKLITEIIERYLDKKSKNLPITKEDRLTKDQIHMVLQPMKPVYALASKHARDFNLRRFVYVKSSSFPLIPELTDGLELDKIRVAMEKLESSKNLPVRLCYASAAKVGAVSKKAIIWNTDGTAKDNIEFEEDNYLVLDRKGFRIQQDIPFDPNKQEIKEVTQASKNLFLDTLDVNGFKLPNDDKEYTGRELYNKFVDIHSQLYQTSKKMLLSKILDGEGKIDIQELRKLLEDEALKRNYNISDRQLIDLDTNLEFLPFSAIESKYQAVLNAIVYNNIVKQKIHGKSFVLGSQVGFKTSTISSAKGIAGIIFTSEFNDDIKASRLVDGELKPNQVILPWKFRDNKGNILDITKFTKEVDGKLVIDNDKLPRELLLGYGMRIPNQAQNSQAVFEIVGFLPESMQDLIIAPEEFTIQMGSDFDVDKLYTYTYNTRYNPKSSTLEKFNYTDSEIRALFYKAQDNDEEVDALLKEIFGEEAENVIKSEYELFESRFKIKELQNQLLDIHISAHLNTDSRVQQAILNPLDNWIIEDVAKEVQKARNIRAGNKLFAPMSESYQTKKFIQATAGKAGVGIFSLDSMFNALAQTTSTLKFKSTDIYGNILFEPIAFGNVKSDGELNRVFTLSNPNETISKVISGYQSAAVDNEKLQVLDKLNINSETFEIIKLLNQLGFGEEVLWFISQDIIFDYVSEIIRLKGQLGEFTTGVKLKAIYNTFEKYGYSQDAIDSLYPKASKNPLYSPSLDDLKSMVKYTNETKPSNFNEAQAYILMKFIGMERFAQDLALLERGINVDSKGFGASLFDSIEKENSIVKQITSSSIVGSYELFGDVINKPEDSSIDKLLKEGYTELKVHPGVYIKPTTIPGLALLHGLDLNNSLWSEISPIASTKFTELVDHLSHIMGTNDRGSRVEISKEIWNGIKSHIFATAEYDPNSTQSTHQRRESLLFDIKSNVVSNENGVTTNKVITTNQSLGTILNNLKDSNIVKSNAFLKRLEVKFADYKTRKYGLIEYRAGVKEGVNETEIYTDFLGLLLNEVNIGVINDKNYTTVDLAKDLIEYSYLTGGIQEATQFIKMIPPAYIKSIGLFSHVTNAFKNKSVPLSLQDTYSFEKEFIKNNPQLLKFKVDIESKEFKERFNPVISKGQIVKLSLDFTPEGEFTKSNIIEYTIGIGDYMIATKYLTIRNPKSSRGYDLYEVANDGSYYLSNTLGINNISEYNSGNESLFSDYRTITTTPSFDNVEHIDSNPIKVEKPIITDTQLDITRRDFLNSLKNNSLQGVDGVKVLLDLLENLTDNPISLYLINILRDNLDKLPSNINITFKELSTRGAFLFSTKNDNLNQLNYRVDYLNRLLSDSVNTSDNVTEVILHELYHAFTARTINKFINGETIDNASSRKAIVSLNSSLREYKERLKSKYSSEYVEFYKKYSIFEKEIATTGKTTIKFTERERSIFYPSVSLKEFTAMSLTSSDLINELKSIISNNNKSLFSKIIDSFIDLLNSILGIDNKTLLYDAVGNSLALITGEELLTNNEEDNNTINKITISDQKYTRQSVENDKDTMYLFTDNAERTSAPNATIENVNKDSWYYKKYKSQTNKPIHFGTVNNPTSAVIRGLNNAYPISTMSAYGTNWTDSNFDLFKQTIDNEIEQIKQDLPKFKNGLKIGNYRIGQGGLKAKLPIQHQNYLDNKLKELGIDNTQINPTIITDNKSYIKSSDYNEEDNNTKFQWARTSENSYEVSSQGDKRFSALYAKLKDGRTIEEAYQLDVKGYRSQGNDWRLGKGKPSIRNISKEQSWKEYKALWEQYLNENPELESDLRKKASGKVLTDKFASTDVSQARALAELLNERTNNTNNKILEKPTTILTPTNEDPFENISNTTNEDTLQKQNLFTVNPIKSVDSKATVKASVATQFIGFGEGISGSSTEAYRQQAGKYANTGNYSSNDVIFVSVPGKRGDSTIKKQQQDKTIREAIKALEAGATIIADNVNYIHYNSKTKQQRPITMSVEEFIKEDGLYNEGEKRLYENLKAKGYNYSEITIQGQTLGVWKKQPNSNITLSNTNEHINTTIESFTEYGTTYTFEIKNDIITNAYYVQGSSTNKLDLNPKNWNSKYQQLKNDSINKPVNTKVDKSVEPKSNKQQGLVFTFNDGTVINTDFQLNEQQQVALQNMADFMNDPTKNMFVLEGYAGTGKTTIIKYLVKYLTNKYNKDFNDYVSGKKRSLTKLIPVKYSSPTHRANAQLNKNVGNGVSTLHKLLGLSPDLDLESINYDNLKFLRFKEAKLSKGDLLILDESSMVQDALFDLIEKIALGDSSNEPNTTKIIFMGDPAQLGPVEGDSNKSKVFNVKDKASLTKVERTKDSPLLDEITYIRNAPNGKPFTYESTDNANGEGVLFTTSYSEFLTQVIKAFSSIEFENDKMLYRVLAGTNKEVEEINTTIRKALYGDRANTEDFIVGEVIMAYANRNLKNEEYELANGTDYEVMETNKGVKVINGVPYSGTYIALKSLFGFNNLYTTFVLDSNSTDEQLLQIAEYIDSIRMDANTAPDPRSRGAYLHKYYKELGDITVPRDVVVTTVDQGSRTLLKTNLHYGYAHTVHKSQGGEYKKVFLNTIGFKKFDSDTQKQLRYVGVSRAKNNAIILYNDAQVSSVSDNTNKAKSETIESINEAKINKLMSNEDSILQAMNDYNNRNNSKSTGKISSEEVSDEDTYEEDLLPDGYITRDILETIKKMCK